MVILVVDHQRQHRDATVRTLDAGGHTVDVACDVAGAFACLDRRMPDAIVLEMTNPRGGADLIKRIRARESISHVYVVATAAQPRPGDVHAAFQAGADDFLRHCSMKDELLVRVDGLNRIRRWAPRVFGGGAREDLAASADLATLNAWKTVDSIVTNEVAEMLGFDLEIATTSRPLDGADFGACLPLTIASEGIEVCVAVGVDANSRAALAECLLGGAGASSAEIADMLREIGNAAAGAFKRMAAAEGRTFTTGLPLDAPVPAAFRRETAMGRQGWVASVAASPITLRFEVEIRARPAKRVAACGLAEGMVLVADVLSDTGAVVLREGTRLTESHLGPLQRLLGETMMVEVMEATMESTVMA